MYVSPSVCHGGPSNCFLLFCFSMESNYLLAVSSPCGTLQNCFLRFLIKAPNGPKERIWKAKDISKETIVYRSLVQSILLYNAETWTLKEENKRSLRVFEMAIVRKILGCSRRDHRRNSDMVKDLALDKDIVEVVRTRRLSYFGHVVRMDSQRYPHKLLHGHIHGNRPRGRPKKRWLDNVTEDCEALRLPLPDADSLAHDSPLENHDLQSRKWSCMPERADSSTSPRH